MQWKGQLSLKGMTKTEGSVAIMAYNAPIWDWTEILYVFVCGIKWSFFALGREGEDERNNYFHGFLSKCDRSEVIGT